VAPAPASPERAAPIRIRLLDARTGGPVLSFNGVARLEAIVPEGVGGTRGGEAFRPRTLVLQPAGGGRRIRSLLPGHEGLLEEGRFTVPGIFLSPGPGPAPATCPAEISVPGYAPKRIDLAALGKEADVALEPIPGNLRGALVLPPGYEGGFVVAVVLPAEGGDAPDGVRGLPTRGGAFVVDGLGEGEWEFLARVSAAGRVRWAVRTFACLVGTADLGEVRVDAWSGLRVRVVDANGRPVLQASLEVSEAGAAGRMGRHAELDASGECVVDDLPPGRPYRVTARAGAETLEADVRTPGTTGEVRLVTLRTEARLVSCRLRFTVEGAEPSTWGDILEFPGKPPAGAWRKDGRLEATLLPGVYRVGVNAVRSPDEPTRTWWGTLEVRAGQETETTVDLRAEAPAEDGERK